MGRYLHTCIETLSLEELRAFANGCLAIASYPGHMDKVRNKLADMVNPNSKQDAHLVFKIMDQPDFSRMTETTRKKFLSGE